MFRAGSHRKLVFFILGGVLAGLVLVLLLRTIPDRRYSTKIPLLPESLALSESVQEQLSEALANALRHPTADNLGMLGMVYHSSANYEHAAQCYKLAIQRSESAWIWNYYLGYLNLEMGDSDAVIENFSKVLETSPDIYLAWYYLGVEYKNLRKNELAERSFGNILDLQNTRSAGQNQSRYDYFPLGTYARFQLARLYFDSGRAELAEQSLLDIIQANRSFGPAYRLLGNIYRVQGDTELGERYGVRANDLVAFSPPVDTLVDRLVLMSRSELYLLKKIDEAENSMYPEWAMRLVDNAILYIPDNKYLISKAIKICLMLNLDQKASAYTDRHIAYFQDNFTEMYNMGLLFFQKGLYPQSMRYSTKALALSPGDARIQISMAMCFWKVGDIEKAHEMLDGLLKENQGNTDILAETTNLLLDLGEEEKALIYLGRLNQTAPGNPKVQKMMAGRAEKNEKFREAIRLYEASFRNDPEDLSTIRSLGNVLYSQKMWEKYILHFRTALEYHPNDPYLLERLGSILVACPDPAWRNTIEGRDYSERAFIHTSSHSMTLVSAGRSLALAYAELGDRQNAWSVISMTLNIARGENLSPSYQRQLESIAQKIQTL